ncbi:MAG: hypothetical protein QOF26_2709 [Baekduia sp.]|nr:hypothetical protein [Baekduia sp.]
MSERALVGNAVRLMASTAAQAALGVVFWIVAARSFTAPVLGVDAALITTMMTLSIVGQLNLGNALLRFLPQLGDRSAAWIVGAYGTAVATSAVLAGAFVLVAPSISSHFGLLEGAGAALGYVLAVSGWVVFVLQDAVLVGMRRTGWLLVENLSFGVLKLAALPATAALGVQHGVVVAWVAPLVLLVPAVNVLIGVRLLPAHVARVAQPGELLQATRRRLLAFLGQDYVGVVLSQATLTALPLVVVASLGDRANAYFYVAFSLASLLDVLVYNAVTALVVEAAHDEARVRELARAAVWRLLGPVSALALLLVAAAPLLLVVFGPAYPHEATDVLRLLACALPFRAAVFLFDAVCRIEGRGTPIVLTQIAGFVLVLPLAIALAGPLGLAGAGVAWLAGSVVVALAVAPMLVGVLRAPAGRAARPRRSFDGRQGAAAIVAVAAPLAVAAGAPGGLRLALLLAFVALVPGTALFAALRSGRAFASPGLVVAAGLAISVMAGQVSLWLGRWSPETTLDVVAGACLLALAAGPRRLRTVAPAVAGPMWVAELDLTDAAAGDLRVPDLGPAQAYGVARVLVRLRGEPLGFVTVPVTDGAVSLEAVTAAACAELGDRIVALRGHARTAAPEAPAPSVSVVLCTRDRAASLRAALTSILATGYPHLELVVVDNAPRTSDTADVVAGLGDPRVRYVLEPRPGLSRARNAGVAAARGALVAFTDDDVVVDRRWLDGIGRGFARAPHVGVVTGMVPAAELDTPAQQYFEAKVQWTASCAPKLFDLGEHRHDHPLYPYSAGVFGTGANFAVSRGALQAIGPFDEALGAGSPSQGGEDLDYFLRAVLGGWAIAYEPAALVWHHHRRDDDALVTQMWGYGAGLGAYVFKHLRQGRAAWQLARVLPRGVLRFARLSRGVGRHVAVPPAAHRTELRGLLAGPASYVRGRRLVRGAQEATPR